VLRQIVYVDCGNIGKIIGKRGKCGAAGFLVKMLK
jgi:predicted RNA-binding protein YlqC (UPF0109 family)